jgi:hypothetical protein
MRNKHKFPVNSLLNREFRSGRGLQRSFGLRTDDGVRRQSIYLWIKEWKVERLVDALKLSRASGIPIEKFAGGMFDTEQSNKTK